MAVQLRRVKCRWCGQIFFVCRRCDFCRRYCSKSCRLKARKHSKRQARRKYNRTNKGRLNNRKRQHRHRRRTCGKNKGKQDFVTDQSSQICLPGVSCSHGEITAESGPAEQPSMASSTNSESVHRTLCKPRSTPHLLDISKEAAELAAGEALRASGSPVRVAQCRFCGRWGVVIETTSTRGRFRVRAHGRHMNPRRIE